MRPPEELLPDDWEYDSHTGGLICPHGHTIEMDGTCPDGCTSPIREANLI